MLDGLLFADLRSLAAVLLKHLKCSPSFRPSSWQRCLAEHRMLCLSLDYSCYIAVVITCPRLDAYILFLLTHSVEHCKCRQLARYRAATRKLERRFPNADMGVLAEENCAICRDRMQVNYRPLSSLTV